ncbi:MAG: hypothetical protein AAGI66_01675 [Cyanobacteria bacterium P01_H01_bin.74]
MIAFVKRQLYIEEKQLIGFQAINTMEEKIKTVFILTILRHESKQVKLQAQR